MGAFQSCHLAANVGDASSPLPAPRQTEQLSKRETERDRERRACKERGTASALPTPRRCSVVCSSPGRDGSVACGSLPARPAWRSRGIPSTPSIPHSSDIHGAKRSRPVNPRGQIIGTVASGRSTFSNLPFRQPRRGGPQPPLSRRREHTQGAAWAKEEGQAPGCVGPHIRQRRKQGAQRRGRYSIHSSRLTGPHTNLDVLFQSRQRRCG